ncbi:MAG: ATPase [Oligoflexia bacterium]|nr:ATPase [Oligoflexia bacterium]
MKFLGDADFAGKLKIIWETKINHNSQNMLILCGSVSSWIYENILKSKDFVGRVSSEISLNELSLADTVNFWKKDNSTSSYEILKILSVTGGVPKYLEEIDIRKSADENLANLCFKSTGFLFNEFEKIFHDVIVKRCDLFKKILTVLSERKLTPKELASRLKISNNGDFLNQLYILEMSGFIQRDFNYSFEKEHSRITFLRLKDNYLRFYFKYILPKKNDILSGQSVFDNLSKLPNWRTIIGLQFENLILSNKHEIFKKLGFTSQEILWAGPYTQRKTLKNKGACQIDLMIVTKLDVIYLCELKCVAEITPSICKEMERKLSVINIPKRKSIRTVLIYDGDISERVYDKINAFFDEIIAFESLL